MSLCMADRTNAAVTVQIDTTDSNMPRISVGHNDRQLKDLNLESGWCRNNHEEQIWDIGGNLTSMKKHLFTKDKSVFRRVSSHLLDATRRSWCLSEAWRTATERTGWWQCCQSRSEDAPRLSWWPDCERGIHLQRGQKARKQGCFFPSLNKPLGQSITRFYFCRPIISPVMKTRLTTQAMQSFLQAWRLASLPDPDVGMPCWQSRSDHCGPPTSEASSLVLKDRTAGFAAVR